MKNCTYLKFKLSRILYCKKKKKEIKIYECSNCQYKEHSKKSGFQQKSPVISKKSKKLNKLEQNRFSIFSDNVNKCYLCDSTCKLTWHEIYRGRNRTNSMKYGLCLRLCLNCHDKYQDDKDFNDMWHKKGQTKFNEVYPDLDFIEIFKRNYL